MRLTPRGRIVVTVATLALLGAFVLGLQAAWITAAFCASLVVGDAIASAIRPDAWSGHRTMPSGLTAGTDGTIDVVVTARRRRTPAVEVVDHVDGRPAARCIVDPLRAGDRATAQWRIRPTRRGSVDIGPLVVIAAGPFDLVHRRAVIAPATSATVLPETVALHAAPPVTSGRARPSTGRAANGDLVDASLREYVVGDDPRMVHWKASARRGELVVRQPDATAHDEVAVVLDTRPEAHDAASFERAVSVVASIVLAASRSGLTVDAWTTGGTEIVSRRDAPTSTAAAVALERLARLQPESDGNRRGELAPPAGSSAIVVTGHDLATPSGAVHVVCRSGRLPGAPTGPTIIDATDGLAGFAARWEAWRRA